MNWKMPKRPKEPPKPLMRIARPGMEEMISRIQDLVNDAKRNCWNGLKHGQDMLQDSQRTKSNMYVSKQGKC